MLKRSYCPEPLIDSVQSIWNLNGVFSETESGGGPNISVQFQEP